MNLTIASPDEYLIMGYQSVGAGVIQKNFRYQKDISAFTWGMKSNGTESYSNDPKCQDKSKDPRKNVSGNSKINFNLAQNSMVPDVRLK